MYSTLFATTLIFALAALRVRADFEVPTIELTQVSDSPKDPPFPLSVAHFVSPGLQCKPANLTWANTQGPYDIIMVRSDNPCGDALYVTPMLLALECLPT